MRKLLNSLLLLLLLKNVNAQKITYYEDVQPIIQANCAPCHQPGKAAPFSLLTYDDVAKRATFIKKVVQSRYMPPWKADNSYVHFVNDRSLTQQQIDLISEWADNKAPEGKKKAVPAKSQALEGTGYNRKPDLVLKTQEPFTVKGDGLERFIVFKIPFELKDTANVEAIEFYSNNEKLVHHANYEFHEVADTSIDIYKTADFINLTDDDRKKYDQYLPYRKTITYYGGWIPGSSYESFPGDIGWVMPKRGVILLTVHYAPAVKDTPSICGINLFFKNTPVKRPVKVISFGSGGIGQQEIKPSPFYIPAGQTKTFSLEVTNPGEDFSLMDVWPHMHYIGKEFTAYLTTPQNDTINLVHIPDWDFRWQEIYRFQHLVHVPKGSTLHITGRYDNTADNPFNPFSPPRTIWSFGDMRSTDEMLTLMMVFLPYQNGDENIKLQK
ncbi:c-type cytochrome [Parafilimonas terrae]|uniref:Copper type II ascorbate-dependent monooxygenase, C-terminal domain n=1 Tax=Parafilimonas terrae TaxID=1465490 RepID=A0A1I5STH5_9BACT|nr:cytochrome c [Parafilimonas terrae]SFP73988.1 hypothetical protein SAMN05444277_101936 [Parafilimonas terrae]